MSAHLLGAAFRASLGTHCRKLILLKLVDAAEDDGSRIFPAVATIARAAECSTRQVQRELKRFCEVGLLRRVRAGGTGPGATSEYAMDVNLLDRLGRDGWDRLFSGGKDGSSDKGDTMSPLEKGDTGDTGRVTSATDKGDSACHPTPPDPSIDPSDGERERAGARDRSGDQGEDDAGKPDDGKSSDGRTVKAFLKAWPTAGVDNRERIETAWMRLTPAERTLALDHIPAWLEANRRAGRKEIMAGSTYLRGKSWELAEKAAPADDTPVVLERWGRAWWAHVFALIAEEKWRRIGLMVSMARQASNWTAKAGEAPDADAVGALIQVHSGSGEWKAWDAWLRERGVNCQIWDRDQWCWVPSRWPPGHSAGSGEAVSF